MSDQADEAGQLPATLVPDTGSDEAALPDAVGTDDAGTDAPPAPGG
ncbi:MULTISPECIES: hypothetical protein [unclassified Streptomyces]|nr:MULTISPECIES: hypothetical protein [unclassified Streptomyces]MYT29852.1 hypothetical protein [Streptomyces sp. SID8354]